MERAKYAYKRNKMKNEDSDLWLYAKNWYIPTDLETDLQKIIACRNGVMEKYITLTDIMEILQEIVFRNCIKTAHQFNEFMKRIGPESWFKKEEILFSHDVWCLRVIRSCLTQMAITPISNSAGEIVISLDDPDPMVLPLTNHNIG